jgi:hypothetical protein
MAIFVYKWVKDNTGIVLASSGFMNLCPYTKQTREQNTEFTIAPSDRFIFSSPLLKYICR